MVFGSWARGAPSVGDLDLLIEVDEERSPAQQSVDAFYRRAHPYSEFVSAMGCGGSSIVSVNADPVFETNPQPISPWRRKRMKAAGESVNGFAVPKLATMGHLITADPVDPQPQLVWVRGDTVEDIAQQLAKFPEREDARRHERTTTVAVIDDLLDRLGVETGFLLAAQIRAGNLSVRPFLVHPRQVPKWITEALHRRYTEDSSRGRALDDAGADLHQATLMREVSIGDMIEASHRRGQCAGRWVSLPWLTDRWMAKAALSVGGIIGCAVWTPPSAVAETPDHTRSRISQQALSADALISSHWRASRSSHRRAFRREGILADRPRRVDRMSGHARLLQPVYREMLLRGPLAHDPQSGH